MTILNIATLDHGTHGPVLHGLVAAAILQFLVLIGECTSVVYYLAQETLTKVSQLLGYMPYLRRVNQQLSLRDLVL